MSEAGPQAERPESLHEARDDHGSGHEAGHGIHMPSPSYYPILAAFGIPLLGYGLLYSPILVIDGVLVLLVGLFGWALEPSAEPAHEAVPDEGSE